MDDGSMGNLVSEQDKALSVMVDPGDVLFIPEFWGHRVTTVEAGVTINTWSSHGTLEALLEKVLPLAYEEPMVRSQVDAAAFAIIKGVVERVWGLRGKALLEHIIMGQFASVLLNASSCSQEFKVVSHETFSASVNTTVASHIKASVEQLLKVSSSQVREAMLVVLTQHVAHWIGGVDGVADVLCCLWEVL